MTKTWRDDTASDLILKDQERQRVPMMARDHAAPCQDCGWAHDIGIVCPTCKSSYKPKGTGDRAQHDALCDDCAGTGKGKDGSQCDTCKGLGRVDGEEAISDSMSARDAYLKHDAEVRLAASGNRPGWRGLGVRDEAAREQLADAYAEHQRRVTTSWRDDIWSENVETLSKVPDDIDDRAAGKADGRTVDQIARDGAAVKEAAYSEYSAQVSSAYKNWR